MIESIVPIPESAKFAAIAIMAVLPFVLTLFLGVARYNAQKLKELKQIDAGTLAVEDMHARAWNKSYSVAYAAAYILAAGSAAFAMLFVVPQKITLDTDALYLYATAAVTIASTIGAVFLARRACDSWLDWFVYRPEWEERTKDQLVGIADSFRAPSTPEDWLALIRAAQAPAPAQASEPDPVDAEIAECEARLAELKAKH